MSRIERYDALVVGAGFGGLGAALALAERGRRVIVCEAQRYPGGCASTFTRSGCRFDAGATLVSGFAPGQLFRRWIDRYRLDVPLQWIDPVVEVRMPGLRLPVSRSRDDLLQRFVAMPDAPRESLTKFFRLQRDVADVLWPLLDDPPRLLPTSVAGLRAHLSRLPRYLPLVRWVGSTLRHMLVEHGLGRFAPLVAYLDGLMQITLQCGVDQAEALFGCAAMDYYHRGTAHVVGGVGTLAWGLVAAVRAAGGEVRLADRVRSVVRDGDGFRADTRGGTIRADRVVCNLLPQDARELLALPAPASGWIARRERAVADGFGACMLYRAVVPPADAPVEARHLELVADPSEPFVAGNHVFCSISGADEPGRAPPGQRTMTVSTHVPMRELRELAAAGQAERVAAIQARMRATLSDLAPEWCSAVTLELPASPRTFEKFTGRSQGLVGGVPRHAGLAGYFGARTRTLIPGVHLVGDSVFPGQSALAAACGGVMCAGRL